MIGKTKHRAQIIFVMLWIIVISSFFGAIYTTLYTTSLLTSRRVLDLLIFSFLFQIGISYVGIHDHFVIPGYKILSSMSICAVLRILLSGEGSFFIVLGAVCLGGGSVYIWRIQQRRKDQRRQRKPRHYILSQLVVWSSILALVTSLALINTLGSSGINCTRIEQHFRLGSISEYFLGEQTSTSFRLPQQSGIFQFFTGMGIDIYDLIEEQQVLLQQNICIMINQQLLDIHERPWWQLGGIVLLYVLFRPLIGFMLRVTVPIQLIGWKLLTLTGIIVRTNKTGTIQSYTIKDR